MNENGWHNMPWMYQDWVPVLGISILAVVFVFSVIWFIDGIIKYAYWWKKDEK